MNSVRTHEDSCNVAYWWGTMTDVMSVLRRAEHEIRQRHPSGDIGERVTVDYFGGNQAFETVDDLARTADTIDPAEVKGIRANIRSPDRSDALTLSFGEWGGASVKVESPDLVWVQGIKSVLRTVLEEHRQPPTQPGRKPLSVGQRLSIGAFVIFGVMMLALPVILGYSAIGYILHIVLWLAGAPLFLPSPDDLAIDTAPFKLLEQDQPAAAPPKPPGWTHTVEGFIRARPILNLVVGFALGVAANKASELL